MRYRELRAIVEYLQRNRFLHTIQRVDDNLLLAHFDRDRLFFDLNRSKNLIYKRDDFLATKRYNAPFDKLLAKRCNKSQIEIELDPHDRIIRIHCTQEGAYKRQESTLVLEFTGRLANAILLDEKGQVLAALHYDFHRDLHPGAPLVPLNPPPQLDRSPWAPEDMEAYLYDLYEQERRKRLSILKTSKLLQLAKQKERLQERLAELQREEELLAQAREQEEQAQLLLANLHRIPPYERVVQLEGFDGEQVCIQLPKEAKNPAHGADLLFQRARKLRQKAEHIHIQREHLQEKLAFLKRKERLVQEATRPEAIELLFAKREPRQSGREPNYERYLIDGFPVYVGKNKRGNVELLKRAKASDFWFHLKGLPSAHVIVATDKKNLPRHVLEEAARLCVRFSVDQPGEYLVDYTQRRNVRIQDGANVTYVNYKSLRVKR
ncbi:MAG: hypothetical protein C6I00_07130 [Nitratiruptor sp.]|nr:hypothetical protein [Nitratiruptor sp.]NPA83807.1 DUF814 domain-containing protein [Campylobacterota bacterium]